MKKILFSLLFLLVSPLFSQTTYRTYNVNTSVVTTAKMVRNYTTNKWDFIMSNDHKSFISTWVFYVSQDNTGTVTNGDVNYDILDFEQIEESTVKIKLYNLKVGREMDMLLIKKDDVLSIAIFDYTTRTSYYFLP